MDLLGWSNLKPCECAVCPATHQNHLIQLLFWNCSIAKILLARYFQHICKSKVFLKCHSDLNIMQALWTVSKKKSQIDGLKPRSSLDCGVSKPSHLTVNLRDVLGRSYTKARHEVQSGIRASLSLWFTLARSLSAVHAERAATLCGVTPVTGRQQLWWIHSSAGFMKSKWRKVSQLSWNRTEIKHRWRSLQSSRLFNPQRGLLSFLLHPTLGLYSGDFTLVWLIVRDVMPVILSCKWGVLGMKLLKWPKSRDSCLHRTRIHPFSSACPIQGRGCDGASQSRQWVRGGLHPGQVTSLSQD